MDLAYYCEMNDKYSIILHFFNSDLCTKAIPIGYIDRRAKLKSSRTCLIGYLVFISCEWFFITWGHIHNDFPDKRKRRLLNIQYEHTYLLHGWIHYRHIVIVTKLQYQIWSIMCVRIGCDPTNQIEVFLQ